MGKKYYCELFCQVHILAPHFFVIYVNFMMMLIA